MWCCGSLGRADEAAAMSCNRCCCCLPCQPADQELALAALPAGQAFVAASEMSLCCWLKWLNGVGKQVRKKSERSHLAEVTKGVIAHLKHSFAGSKTCKMTN